MKLHLLCGIPGSGKSTLARRLSGFVLSTDQIRNFLWGDEAVVEHDRLVFNLARDIFDYLLSKGQDVVFDATNLTIAKRRGFIERARKNGATVILHRIECSLHTALKRNESRERKVPEMIIRLLYKSYQKPKTEEGINVIKIYGENLRLKKISVPGKTFKRCYTKTEGRKRRATYFHLQAKKDDAQ